MRSSLRANARPLIVVVALCGALAIAPAVPASAAPRANAVGRTPSGLTRRSFERRLLSMARSRPAARPLSGTGRATTTPTSRVMGAFHVKSHDATYPDWFIGALRANGETYIAAGTGRDSTDGFQEYEWIKQVPNADVIAGSRLLTFAIHTGTDLGSFGAIDMTFVPVHGGTHRYRCPKTGKVLALDHHVQGFLSGTMSFFPGTTGLPTAIHATHPHGMLDRTVESGARCPHPFFGCLTGNEFVVSGGDGVLRADPEYGFIEAETTSQVDGFTVYRIVYLFPEFPPGDNPVTLTPTDLTIDGDAAGDLFGGSVVFDRSGPSVKRVGPRCQTVTTPFLWRAGALDVKFDTGTFTFTGADLDARLRTMGRAR